MMKKSPYDYEESAFAYISAKIKLRSIRITRIFDRLIRQSIEKWR